MSRLLLAIGCNKYEYLPELRGAEGDAKRIEQLVVGPSPFGYRADLSHTLLSPRLIDVRAAFSRVYEDKPAAIFVYFGGHAESRDGRLYLKFRDTRDSTLPLSALAFGDLLGLVTGIDAIAEINVVIDACNAGGITADLAKHLGALAQQAPGQASIAILAGASSSLGAVETAAGGVLTGAICDVLAGANVAQRHSRFLDLLQVSETIARIPKVSAQQPSYWGMNLRGPNQFAPNPAFDPMIAATAVPDIFFKGDVHLTPQQINAVRAFLNAVETKGFQASMLRPVQVALAELSVEQQTTVLIGLSESVGYQEDVGALPVQRYLMLFQGLLPLSENNKVAGILDFYLSKLIEATTSRLLSIYKNLELGKYALFGPSPGFSDLYFLPLTVLDTLGWIGFLMLHDRNLNDEKLDILKKLASRILDIYGNSIVCIEDTQTPSLVLFFLGCRVWGWRDEAEEVLSRLYHDALLSGGRVARESATAVERLRFLSLRYDLDSDLLKLTQRPTELIAAVLFCGAIAGLDGIWDGYLAELDHLPINIFLTDSVTGFADDRIASGSNLTMRVGHEFHTLADLRRFLREEISSPRHRGTYRPNPVLDAISLALGDRTNWVGVINLVRQARIRLFKPKLVVRAEDPETGIQEVLFAVGEEA